MSFSVSDYEQHITLTVIKNDETHIQNPFFNNQENSTLDDKNRPKIMTAEYGNFMTSKLPYELQTLYFCVNDITTEIKIKDWTFLTLKEMMERSKLYDNILDIATSYMGMGHIIILTYDTKNNTYFIRHDGGSNGYDREYYYNHYKTLDTDMINQDMKYNNFTDILSLIISKKTFKYYNP